MIHWQDTLGVSLFIFRDPVFSIDRQHTLQLCELLISSRRKFKFVIETHLNRIDCELAIQLRQAGLQMVKTGVESFNKDILKSSKRFFLEHDTEINTIRFIEKLGIKVTCFYILCLPDDSVKNCEDTLRYAKILNTYGAQFSIFTPYPGTPIFDKYKNIILTDCYETLLNGILYSSMISYLKLKFENSLVKLIVATILILHGFSSLLLIMLANDIIFGSIIRVWTGRLGRFRFEN
jgi:radical SAM superfamily enzyme YgiQ (UPF0313 family)